MDFITQDEKDRIEAKLDELVKRRPEVIDRIAEARAHGDLKENAEYHAARDDQGMDEAEIRRLTKRLKTAHVADNADIPEDMVFLGATVKLRDVKSGDEDVYKLVGEASGNFDSDEIEVTVSSPLGDALLKSRVGETIKADLPRGTKHFEILELL
ncbi:MAG: transcription elongation factor GreA [Algisphaera sp.]